MEVGTLWLPQSTGYALKGETQRRSLCPVQRDAKSSSCWFCWHSRHSCFSIPLEHGPVRRAVTVPTGVGVLGPPIVHGDRRARVAGQVVPTIVAFLIRVPPHVCLALMTRAVRMTATDSVSVVLIAGILPVGSPTAVPPDVSEWRSDRVEL